MWNDLKLFTGDVDIPLTEKGVMEALAGGKAVSEVDFDIIFTRRLVRSKQTALNAMTQLPDLFVKKSNLRGTKGWSERQLLVFEAISVLAQGALAPLGSLGFSLGFTAPPRKKTKTAISSSGDSSPAEHNGDVTVSSSTFSNARAHFDYLTKEKHEHLCKLFARALHQMTMPLMAV
ncbi:hypothetical protein AXG93_4831s1070 [Marchantia polymorpha subsp. ruderalis]|uniref:phosphoglycerate mutase (2,3-diphosphoglycerate-dependent) n=1 Tax=Marchantia polymorpha subsp. ruderalis TaxID=1480154 RepID=A0A176W8B5_MARPO|nr:hypothetical protein AXG93_4831s1070 [Marchantia polymorpha subsp. ruderalis]